jgi:hypothetical protein
MMLSLEAAMTRFLSNWEVESDIILPEGTPFLQYSHPAGRYTIFLRNLASPRLDEGFLSMQLVFDAPSLTQAKSVAEGMAKEFLDFLAFVSNLKARLRSLLHIFNWEPGHGMREALYFTRSAAHDDAPYPALESPLLDTIALLQTHNVPPRLRRALKWFSNGVTSKSPDDQFIYFWFVIELVAQLIKEPSPVPDRCPTCRKELYCPTCLTSPLHRPYPKQAIEQLFVRYASDDPPQLYTHATTARNMLMHGDDVGSIEAELQIDFPDLVNNLGHLAWISLLNQFLPVLVNRQPALLRTNQYVYYNLSGRVHLQTAFIPNFDNPDPAHFPGIQVNFNTLSPPTPGPAKPGSGPTQANQ